jgi:hypothetical protein
MISKTAGELNSLSSSKKLSMKGEIRRGPRMVLRGLARNAVAEEAVAARPSSRRRDLLAAVTRGETMMARRMMTSPASTSFRKLLKPCALTEAPHCIPLTADSNSERARSMRQSRRSMPGNH